MKSAYELALERLARQGVEPPSADSLTAAVKTSIAEARAKARASLAELEILHDSRMRTASDPAARLEAEQAYLEERRRIEARRDRDIERLRKPG